MKATWTKPLAEVEQFMANEYVAASCGDQNTVYNFECDAPGGTLYYYPVSDGKVDGVYTGNGDAVKLGSYTPCEAKHEASTTDDFYDGYITNRSMWGGTTTRQVIVWRGPRNDNGHATAELDMTKWETAKS